ncbi:MAG TPA: ethanolamine ammonia-lyase subunit EutC [Acetobacteraceae bacterium]|jgi:ethanolamine ammonia-lyase small subunit|nr:ethanolamine ammonia-lyase subunit EutC [Acetobacteraceae bacterium]
MTAPPPVRWTDLRRFTPARVALGRVGNGMPTAAHLAFQAAHAAARDAVHTRLDTAALQAALAALGIAGRIVRSACPDRPTYLRRPDLGRLLDPADAAALAADPARGCTAFVLCDGLSPAAVQHHAPPLLESVLPSLGAGSHAVVVIATQARVALGDAVGAALGAAAVVVLVGERPGLSAAESLGAYLTWAPRPGRTDAERNCISNIRPDGLPVAEATAKLLWLLREMRRLRLSGFALKDEQPALPSMAAP